MSIRTSIPSIPALAIRLALAGWLALAVPAAARGADMRYGVFIGDQFVGFAASAEGGHARGVVVQAGDGSGRGKALGGLENTPLRLRVGAPLDPALQSWVAESLAGAALTKTLELVKYDAAGTPLGTRVLHEAVLIGVTFPLLNVASQDPAYVELEVMPEGVAYRDGGAPAGAAKPPPSSVNQFRVKLGELPSQGVMKVAALRWSRSGPGGNAPFNESGVSPQPKVGDLELHVADSDAAPWEKWFRDFAITGNNDDSKELDGAIELLASDAATATVTLTLSHVGPFAMEDSPDVEGYSVVRLYVEGIGLAPAGE